MSSTIIGDLTVTDSLKIDGAILLMDQVDNSTIEYDVVANQLKVKNQGICDPQICDTASIGYSKLNLTNSIVDADVKDDAAISDTKLAQITSTNKVADSANPSLSSATNNWIPNTLVKRDSSGNAIFNKISTQTIAAPASLDLNPVAKLISCNNSTFSGVSEVRSLETGLNISSYGGKLDIRGVSQGIGMTAVGRIDLGSASGIGFATTGDISSLVSGGVGIEAIQDIDMKTAGNIILTGDAGVKLDSNGKIGIASYDAIEMSAVNGLRLDAGNSVDIVCGGGMGIKCNSGIGITSGTSIGVTGTNISVMASTGDINFLAKQRIHNRINGQDYLTMSDVSGGKVIAHRIIKADSGLEFSNGKVIKTGNTHVDITQGTMGPLESTAVPILATRIGSMINVWLQGFIIANTTGSVVTATVKTNTAFPVEYRPLGDMVINATHAVNGNPTRMRCLYRMDGTFLFQNDLMGALTLNPGQSLIIAPMCFPCIRPEP